MVTEMALLPVKKAETALFEAAFHKAQEILRIQSGYLGHELLKGVEQGNNYLLLIRWETLEDHTEGFRGGAGYPKWKALLHHFYDPFPEVVHFKSIY